MVAAAQFSRARTVAWVSQARIVHILEMNGDSYRLKHSRESAAAPAPAQADNG